MVALLQQAGLAASFELGQIRAYRRAAHQLARHRHEPGSVEAALDTGGFPSTTLVSGGVVTGAQLDWAWVSVDIGGTNYIFDPSTKNYNRSAGIANIASALGYSQSSFLSDAQVAPTPPSTTITGLSRTNVRADLETTLIICSIYPHEHSSGGDRGYYRRQDHCATAPRHSAAANLPRLFCRHRRELHDGYRARTERR